MKTKVCVGCAGRGFEIIDLETLETQPLLDHQDPSLKFVLSRPTARPLTVFRVDTDFLLCYDG
jgi:hypothetical protein